MADTTIDSSSASWLTRLHEWREEHISDRMFVLVLAGSRGAALAH